MGVDAKGSIVIATYPDRAKSRNALRNPQASLCVLSDEFNGEWVQVDGRIDVVEQPDSGRGSEYRLLPLDQRRASGSAEP